MYISLGTCSIWVMLGVLQIVLHAPCKLMCQLSNSKRKMYLRKIFISDHWDGINCKSCSVNLYNKSKVTINFTTIFGDKLLMVDNKIIDDWPIWEWIISWQLNNCKIYCKNCCVYSITLICNLASMALHCYLTANASCHIKMELTFACYTLAFKASLWSCLARNDNNASFTPSPSYINIDLNQWERRFLPRN